MIDDTAFPIPPIRVLGPRVDIGPVELHRRDLAAEERTRAQHRLEHVERLRRTPWGTYVPLPTATSVLQPRESAWPTPTELAGLPVTQRLAILDLADRFGCSEGSMAEHAAKLQGPASPAVGLALVDPSGTLAPVELELAAAAEAAGFDPERAACLARALAAAGLRPPLEVFEDERDRMLRGEWLGPAAAPEAVSGGARGPSDGTPALRPRGLSGVAWPRLSAPGEG